MIGKFIAMVQDDIRSVYERDPAARSTLEILLTYAGLHAIWGFRISHWLWTRRAKLLGLLVPSVKIPKRLNFEGLEAQANMVLGERLLARLQEKGL